MAWDFQPIQWKGLLCHQTPQDMWMFHDLLWANRLRVVVEVGPGQGGTTQFLRDLGAMVISVDKGDPVPDVRGAIAILDGDVESEASVTADLNTYGPISDFLVVCHTDIEQWGSKSAVKKWMKLHPEFAEQKPRWTSGHTWLNRVKA